jgi:hypothetical protein
VLTLNPKVDWRLSTQFLPLNSPGVDPKSGTSAIDPVSDSQHHKSKDSDPLAYLTNYARRCIRSQSSFMCLWYPARLL